MPEATLRIGAQDNMETPETEPTTETVATGDTTEPQQFNFKQHISEEYRNNKLLERVPDIDTLAKNYIEGQKYISKTRANIPAEDASQEEWDKFYGSLGRPENPDDYGSMMPEVEGILWDETKVKDFNKLFHSAGLTPKQAEIIREGYVDIIRNDIEMVQENTMKAEADLKGIWGKRNFDRNIGRVKVMVERFGPEGSLDHFNAQGFGRDPVFLQMMANIAKNHIEDGAITNAESGSWMSKEDAQTKLKEIQSNPAYFDKRSSEHTNLVKEALELNQYIYGDDPVGNSTGIRVSSRM
jgi:hypothetical protein